MPEYKRKNAKISVGFAGTPEFGIPALAALYQAFGVQWVISQPDKKQGRGKKLKASAVKTWALEHQIPVFTPEKISQIATMLDQAQLDVLVVAAYGQWIPTSILQIPKWGCLNIHASLLPRFRGASPINRAIWAGDSVTGISLMHMTAGMDEGPIYRTESLPIRSDETAITLTQRLADLSGTMIVPCVDQLPHLTPYAQPDHGIVLAPRLTKSDGLIDWSQSAFKIERQVRALLPWPKASSRCGQAMSILKAQARSCPHHQLPGTVLAYDRDGLLVAAGDQTSLCIMTLQQAGQPAMPVSTFYHGHRQRFVPLTSVFSSISELKN